MLAPTDYLRSVILSKPQRGASKDPRTELPHSTTIVRRFLDSLHSLGMTQSVVRRKSLPGWGGLQLL